jgi:hypothetical protein
MKSINKDQSFLDDINLYLNNYKLAVEQEKQNAENDAAKRGDARGSYVKFDTINRTTECWSNSIHDIYIKIGYMPVKNNVQIDKIRNMITKFIEDYYNIIDGMPQNMETSAYLIKQYQKIQTAIQNGDFCLLSKLTNEKQIRFRTYFPVILGIGGTLLGALLGAIIGAYATLYASGLVTWLFK